jgi:adhesin transport system outer membrane protein
MSGCASPAAKQRVDTTTVSAIPGQGEPTRPATVLPEPPAGPMTIETAVRRAVLWHPAVGEAVARLRQQMESVNEAEAGYMPQVGWGIDSGYDSTEADRYRPMLNVRVSQTIYDFGKIDGRVRVASAEVESRQAGILVAIDDLAYETAAAMIQVQRYRKLVGVTRDQVADVKGIQELVKTRTTSGASTESDLLQAQARVQTAEATKFQLEGELRRWEGILATLTATQGVPGIKDERPAWLASACSAGDIDWQRVPAVLEAEAAQKTASAQLDLTRAEARPSIALEGRVGTDLARMGDRESEFRIGLGVTGDIFNGGASAARSNAAGHALAASKAAVERARFDVQRALREAGGQIASLSRLRDTLKRTDAALRKTRELYRMQYRELGTRTLLDVLNADQELHAARLQATNAEYDLRKLGLDCIYNSGRIRQVFNLIGYQVQGVAL